MNSYSSIIDSLEKISIGFLLEEPFYGHLLMGLPRSISTQIESISIAPLDPQSIQLLINESFWNSLNEDQRKGAVKKELLHFIFQNFLNRKKYANKIIFNLAADLMVNQFLKQEEHFPNAVTFEIVNQQFEKFAMKLKKGKSLDYYYEQLIHLFRKSPFLFSNLTLAPTHQHWIIFENKSESEQKIIQYEIRQQIVKTIQKTKTIRNKGLGDIPEYLITQIIKEIEPKDILTDWKRLLRLFATSSRKTYIKNTIHRTSKRYGTNPGIKVQRRNNLLVAIDTSGSLSDRELATFFREIKRIYRLGATIKIIECDNQIQANYSFKGFTPAAVKGRGSTSFDPVIEYANQKSFDAIIYFTDGRGITPTISARSPILWVITAGGINEQDFLWKQLKGQKIKCAH